MAGGRPPKEKSFANMLNIAIKEAHDDKRDKLRAVADKLVELAIAGDMQAIKEIGDRLDGKPAQAIEGSLTHEAGDSIAALMDAVNGRTRTK